MSSANFKKCPKCQAVAAINAPFCAICGHQYRTQFTPSQGAPDPTQAFMPVQQQQPGATAPSSHSPGIAALLTFVLIGAGQMYNGQVAKGFVILAATVFLVCAFWPISILIWIVALVDAIAVANKKQKGFYIDPWQFF